MMGSTHIYDMSTVMSRKGPAPELQGVEVALAPEELELDPMAMTQKYEEHVREQQAQVEKEDFSDMVAEHAAKQKVGSNLGTLEWQIGVGSVLSALGVRGGWTHCTLLSSLSLKILEMLQSQIHWGLGRVRKSFRSDGEEKTVVSVLFFLNLYVCVRLPPVWGLFNLL